MRTKNKVTAIIPAAGLGRRLGLEVAKPFVGVFGKPILIHTLLALQKAHPFFEFIIAVDSAWILSAQKSLKDFRFGPARLVVGGRSRAESVRKALEQVSDQSPWVLVHDAARPLVSRAVVQNTLRAAWKSGAAIAALGASSTVKRSRKDGLVIETTEDRRRIFLAQTPQVFERELLRDRYRLLGDKAYEKTDEAALFDGSKVCVALAPGEAKNIKITTQEDLQMLKFYLRAQA